MTIETLFPTDTRQDFQKYQDLKLSISTLWDDSLISGLVVSREAPWWQTLVFPVLIGGMLLQNEERRGTRAPGLRRRWRREALSQLKTWLCFAWGVREEIRGGGGEWEKRNCSYRGNAGRTQPAGRRVRLPPAEPEAAACRTVSFPHSCCRYHSADQCTLTWREGRLNFPAFTIKPSLTSRWIARCQCYGCVHKVNVQASCRRAWLWKITRRLKGCQVFPRLCCV